MKDSESKLVEIKLHNETLYQYVLDKKIKLQDAYNLTKGEIEIVREYKGRGTRSKNMIGLSKEMDRIMKMYKPSLDDLLDSIKKQFVFTFDDKLKDYLKK